MGAAGIVMGGGLQMYGNYRANQAEADALEKNAQFLESQAKLTVEASKREHAIFSDESDQFFGSQVNAFAKAGVDPSGSALSVMATTQRQIAQEGASILATGRRQSELSLLKAQQARDEANRLGSFETTFLQTASTGLNMGSMLARSGS